MNLLCTSLIAVLLQATSIEGSVVLLGTSEPIANAAVELRIVGDERLQYSVTTNDEGKFAFLNVAEGSYRVAVTNPGHVRIEYGQRSPVAPLGRGEILRVGAGQRLTGLQIPLTPTAAIQGRVYGVDGRPFVKATVEALKPTFQSGQQSFTVIQSALTNDLGEYRLFWLTPGKYYLRVSAPDWGLLGDGVRLDSSPSPLPRITSSTGSRYAAAADSLPLALGRSATVLADNRYVPIYFPNTPSPEAAGVLDLKPGDNRGGVDLLLTPVRTRRIRGTLVDEMGQPPARIQGYAMSVQSSPGVDGGLTTANEKGEFEIKVPLSAITLSAIALRSSVNGISITGGLSIPPGETDIEGIKITLTPGFNLAGQITFEGGNSGATDPRFKDLRVALQGDPLIYSLRPNDNGAPSDTGAFALLTTSGDYRVDVPPILDRASRVPATNPVAYVKSIHYGNEDVLNRNLRLSGPPADGVGLRIVIADDWGSVSGSVLDTTSKPITTATVVLVPAVELRSRRDLFKAVTTDANGQFRMERVPPGTYKLFAWEEIEAGAWFDPTLLPGIEEQGKGIRVGARSVQETQVTVVK